MNLVVSPHLDDACLSAGQMIADNTDCTVVTVFAGIPPHDQLTSYDEQSSFTSSREAVIARRAEDIRAMRVLAADYVHLEHLDSQYRELRPKQIRESLEKFIVSFFPKGEKRRVIGPLGIRHPDHECVSDALRELAEPLDLALYLYEEVPYRVLWPDEACQRVENIILLNIDEAEAHLGVGDKNIKRKAVAHYVSQRWSTDMDCVFVPERFWQVR